MPARLDPFLDVFLREQAEQLYLLPDEPVTMVKDGKPRKVSKQPLTDAHIYALLAEIAPSESADQIDQKHETEFEYAAGRGLLKIRIVPDNGRLTAVVTNVPRAAPPPPPTPSPSPAEVTAVRPGVRAAATPPPAPAAAPAPPLRPPRPSAIAAAPMVQAPVATPAAGAAAGLPGEFADSQYQAAEQRLGALLKAPVTSGRADLHLRVGEPPIFRTGGDLVLIRGRPPSPAVLDLRVCALIDLINRERSDHIITIDDAIEFVHENKKCRNTQRQVHVHTESVKSALRAALREDPDIVLVGELRDLETIAIAIETAETGHLVFGTLHTTTAASTVDRMIDQFPADRQAQIRVMLSESLKGVIAQTLCKKKGGGRVAAREILLTTPAVSNLIREAKTFQLPSIIQTSRKLGMNTLNDALFDLVEKGLVEPDEAYMKSVEKAGLLGQFKAKGIRVTIGGEA